jgi:hypothetical protein
MLPFLPVPMDVAQQAWVQVRGEERVRTGNDVTAAETELNPQARYDFIWQGGQSHFVAIYQPRLVYAHVFDTPDVDPNVVNLGTLATYEADPTGGFRKADPNRNPLSTLHNGGFGFEHVRRRWRLSAYQFGAYGPITTTALLVQPPWNGAGYPADPNPIIPSTVAARFTLLFLQTQIFAPIRVSPRVAVIPGFVYNAFGGAESDSRAVIAMTRGPAASLAVEVAATKRDRLTTTVGGGQVQVLFQGDRTGPSIVRAEAMQSWRHWWGAGLTSEVVAGGAVGGDEIQGFTAFSLARAGVLYDSYTLPRMEPGAPPMGVPAGRGNRLQIGAVAKVEPWLDLFSGQLEQRGIVSAATNYTIERTTLRFQLAAGRVLPTPNVTAEYQIVQAETSLRYAFTDTFASDLGIRYGYQEFDNAIRFNSLSQTMFFGGLTWAPLPARF